MVVAVADDHAVCVAHRDVMRVFQLAATASAGTEFAHERAVRLKYLRKQTPLEAITRYTQNCAYYHVTGTDVSLRRLFCSFVLEIYLRQQSDYSFLFWDYFPTTSKKRYHVRYACTHQLADNNPPLLHKPTWEVEDRKGESKVSGKGSRVDRFVAAAVAKFAHVFRPLLNAVRLSSKHPFPLTFSFLFFFLSLSLFSTEELGSFTVARRSRFSHIDVRGGCSNRELYSKLISFFIEEKSRRLFIQDYITIQSLGSHNEGLKRGLTNTEN